ncbi:MAG: DUF5615 family PIN-like protein [Candidatus Binatia bacterium]
MWLLDVNLPNGLVTFLRRDGVSCETAVSRGWRELTNGSLAAAAFAAGFRVILTRDRLFGSAAESRLRTLPELAVVVVTLPQTREATYLVEFEACWRRTPISPASGEIIEWP